MTDTDLPCPRCDAHLVPFSAFDAQLHRCEHCDGVWVPASFVKALASNAALRARLAPLAQRAASGGALPVAHDATVCCAECRRPLTRFEAGGSSKIFLDTCKPHGTWFDKDELGHVVAFLRSHPDAPLLPPSPVVPRAERPLKQPPKTPAKKPAKKPPKLSSGEELTGGDLALGVLAFVLEILS